MMITWTQVHAIDAPRSHPTPAMPPRRLQKKNSRELSPTRRKMKKLARTKGRGAVRICVTGPIISPGPTNPWALQMPASPLATWCPLGRPRGLAWPLPRVRISSGHSGSPRGPRSTFPGGLACRVASARVPRATAALLATSAPRSCGNKPPFCKFKNQLKIKINSGKIQKNLKYSEIHIFKIIIPFNLKFSPLDHNSLSF